MIHSLAVDRAETRVAERSAMATFLQSNPSEPSEMIGRKCDTSFMESEAVVARMMFDAILFDETTILWAMVD